MKYFEYLYLILLGMAVIFLVKEWEGLVSQGRIMLIVVTAIFAFMFSFRRNQRINAEKQYLEELQAMENESLDNAEHQN